MQEPFTPAQLRVLRVIATGATNIEAAQQLALSVRTIESHLSEMRDRSGLKTRTQLTVMALREGLLDLEEIEYVEQDDRVQ